MTVSSHHDPRIFQLSNFICRNANISNEKMGEKKKERKDQNHSVSNLPPNQYSLFSDHRDHLAIQYSRHEVLVRVYRRAKRESWSNET